MINRTEEVQDSTVVVVGGTKGGTGKSTVATNLTIAAAIRGKDVLLIDADDQETSTDFSNHRHEQLGDAGYTTVKITGEGVRTEVLRLKKKYQLVIVDCGGRDTQGYRAAVCVADVILNPFEPSSFDLWSLTKDVKIMRELRPANPKVRAYTLLNKAEPPPHQEDNDETAELLQDEEFTGGFWEYSGIVLVRRKVYKHAQAAGLSVSEILTHPVLKKKHASGAREASRELEQLYALAFGTEPQIGGDAPNGRVSAAADLTQTTAGG